MTDEQVQQVVDQVLQCEPFEHPVYEPGNGPISGKRDAHLACLRDQASSGKDL